MEPYNFGKDDALEASLVDGAGDLAYKFSPNVDVLEGDDDLFRDGEDDVFDGSALEDTAASDTADTSDETSEAVDFDDINDVANVHGPSDVLGSVEAAKNSVKVSSPLLPSASAVDGKELTTLFYEVCSRSPHLEASMDKTASSNKAIHAPSKMEDAFTHGTDKGDTKYIDASEEVINISKPLAKPNMSFAELHNSSVASLLPSFLARMAAANNELKTEEAIGTIATRRMELDESADEAEVGQYIEMNLGLGVLQEKDDMTSSSDDETSSDNSVEDIMQKLLGGKRRHCIGEDDGKSASKKPKIDEL